MRCVNDDDPFFLVHETCASNYLFACCGEMNCSCKLLDSSSRRQQMQVAAYCVGGILLQQQAEDRTSALLIVIGCGVTPEPSGTTRSALCSPKPTVDPLPTENPRPQESGRFSRCIFGSKPARVDETTTTKRASGLHDGVFGLARHCPVHTPTHDIHTNPSIQHANGMHPKLVNHSHPTSARVKPMCCRCGYAVEPVSSQRVYVRLALFASAKCG